MDIKIIKDKISLDELKKIAQEIFGNMVKAVADVEKGIMAIGGEWHSDAEAKLIESGSKSQNLWGFNIYPWEERDKWLEFDSLINIKPSQNNRSMQVESEEVRNKIKNIVERLVVSNL